MRKGVKSYAPELTIRGGTVCLFAELCWLCVLVHIFAVIKNKTPLRTRLFKP